MKPSFLFSTVDRFLTWAQSNSLWFTSTGLGCCADEMLETLGCRYDLERFGCLGQSDPRQADLLVISGALTYKAAPYLQSMYLEMREPRYVIALGACACRGGAFHPGQSYSVVPGADEVVPVDIFVPGCPPRPEAIMNGLITLQEKINEGR